MAVETYKILEEYVFDVEGLGYPVKGRVSYIEGMPESLGGFFWEISHCYKPTADALGVYRPSRRNGQTLEEARDLLFAYAQNFQTFEVSVERY